MAVVDVGSEVTTTQGVAPLSTGDIGNCKQENDVGVRADSSASSSRGQKGNCAPKTSQEDKSIGSSTFSARLSTVPNLSWEREYY